MHPTILAQRKAIALNRIVVSADALASHLKLPTALTDALKQPVKDPQVREMSRLEAIADLLAALEVSSGSRPEAKPMDTSIPGPVPPQSAEPLPVPTLSDEGIVAESEPTSRKKRGGK